MPNIASLLKEEIIRLARKELRGETEKLRKASTQYRSEIAALKRRAAALEQEIGRLQKLRAKQGAATAATEPTERRPRFSAKGLRSLRGRLGISAADLAKLIGVSEQSVYNWELGNTRPRDVQVVAIAALRGTGKREIAARLEGESAPAESAAAKRRA